MRTLRMTMLLGLAGAAALIVGPASRVDAQEQTIKIGVLYDHTGPYAAAGSVRCWRGAKMMIDYVNDRGGVLGKYKIVPIDGDSQSKAEVAINEAERLLNVEKVDILAGVYSSAHAVPLAEKVDRQKKFLWITTAISSKVFDGRNLQYTFRPQPTGTQFGELSVQYIADYAQEKLKKAPKDLRLAIIYEDGAYGTDVALGNELKAKDLGLNVVLKEGYSINAPDLSSLVTKLRAARPDVLYHTGYNPDISLFLRQAKEQGLRLRAYIGHGAGHPPGAGAGAARDPHPPGGGGGGGGGVISPPPAPGSAAKTGRASPPVSKTTGGNLERVYPRPGAPPPPVLPLPASSPFAAR